MKTFKILKIRSIFDDNNDTNNHKTIWFIFVNQYNKTQSPTPFAKRKLVLYNSIPYQYVCSSSIYQIHILLNFNLKTESEVFNRKWVGSKT